METIDRIEYLKGLEIEGLDASFQVSRDAVLATEATGSEHSLLNWFLLRLK